MYRLIQIDGDITYIHGISDSVSELIAFYYRCRKHFGYMVVIDTSDGDRGLATLGSPL